MDAFFAAVEQQRRSELIGKPLVIGGSGDPTKRGVVSTASYEARKFGIHSAMPLRAAYKLCPQAIFLPVDYEAYARESQKIKGILQDIAPLMEDVGIDEAFLDISPIDKPSEVIAGEIKARIKEETGLSCSIGIAPNKLLAKISSDLQKPDGLTMIMEADVERVIWPLPVRKLLGIGPKTEAYLQSMNIRTIGDLASLPLSELVERLGSSYGNYLYQASRGIDESPLVTHWEPKSMSRETTFQVDVDNWQVVAQTLAELTRQLVADMKEAHYRARTFTLKIRFSDFETLTRARTLAQFTDSKEEVRRAFFECLRRVELKKKVRLIGVRAGNLSRKEEAVSVTALFPATDQQNT
jgi:DNA polymerase IV